MATSSAPSSPQAFPRKGALSIASAVVLLAGWHHWTKSSKGLDPGTFADAARLRLSNKPVEVAQSTPAQGTNPVARTDAHSTQASAPAQVSEVFLDDSRALDPFFSALWDLESQQKKGVVTILHYGDSPTTADLITGDARALLQQRFGDAGHGFNLIAKPWAWYGHRDVEITDHGWKASTGVGSMRAGVYGLGGATFTGGTDAHSTFRLKGQGQTAVEVSYLLEPGGGSLHVAADGQPLADISTSGASPEPAWTTVHLPESARSVEISVTSGQVRIFGVDFRRGERGVVYDSLGLNGASTTVISRTFSAPAWTAELQHANPGLIIINYGTNESSFAGFVQKQYEGELRSAIAKARSALPGVPILIMSPMDRGQRSGLNEIDTMPTIPEIIAIQRKVALDTRCAFFDTYNAMGGSGTFSRWYASKPRLVTADLIHPTPQGAEVVAKLLVANLSLGYDRWKRSHGIITVASPASVAAAPPPAPLSRPAPVKSASKPSAAIVEPKAPSDAPNGGVPPSVEEPLPQPKAPQPPNAMEPKSSNSSDKASAPHS